VIEELGGGAAEPPRVGQPGLRNLGSTCHLGALVQGLCAAGAGRALEDYGGDSPLRDPLICALAELIGRMEGPPTFPAEALDPRGVFASLAQRYPAWADRHREQDPTELLALCMSSPCLCEMFEVGVSTTITCRVCNTASILGDKQTTLRASLPADAPADGAAVSLQAMVAALRDPVELSGETAYYCEECKDQRDASSVLVYTECSDRALAVVVDRFVRDDGAHGNHRKLHTPVEFGPDLTIPIRGADGKELGVVHDLCAVIVHLGRTPRGGHYIAYIKDAVSKQWQEQNDDRVTPVTEAEVFAREREAYMLLYRRRPDPSTQCDDLSESTSADLQVDPPDRYHASQCTDAHPPTCRVHWDI
jgi:uncharacterized UBP type Zn finger protein